VEIGDYHGGGIAVSKSENLMPPVHLGEILRDDFMEVSTRIKGSQFHQSKGNRVLRASSAGRRQKLYRSLYMRTEFDLIQLSASVVRPPVAVGR